VILPGEGGEDSRLFAEQLADIYLKHAKANGIKAERTDTAKQRIRIKLTGEDPLKFFWKERGTHRVQRCPPTEQKGRIHTSILNVALVDSLQQSETKINIGDVIVSYYKDSGSGGQHRNKTMSGVRLQYDGIMVECCEGKVQGKNKETAFKRLRERLDKRDRDKVSEKIDQQYKSQNPNKGKRGDYARNYNFPRNEVKQDGKKFSLSKFLRGDLKKIYKG
jgi:peptide chain release factor 1